MSCLTLALAVCQPGESYTFVEDWDLRRVAEEINGAQDIPKLLVPLRKMASPRGVPVGQ